MSFDADTAAIAAETRVNGPDIDDARYTAYPARSPSALSAQSKATRW